MLDDVFEFLFRVVGQFVFEAVIKGPGYVLLGIFHAGRCREIDIDGCAVLLTGLAFWATVGIGAWMVLR